MSLKDIEVGSEAAVENLKKVFGLEGGTTLESGGMSAANVDITFGTPKDGKVKFTAGPKDAKVDAFFMKVKLLRDGVGVADECAAPVLRGGKDRRLP